MKPYILVIDEGTTGVRTMIFDRALGRVAKAYEKLTLSYPKPDWVEQSAQEVYEKTVATLKAAVAEGNIDPEDIACIGISTQRCTWVLWDKATGEPVTPMITWMDRRAIAWYETLKGRQDFQEKFPQHYQIIQPQQVSCCLSHTLRENEDLRKRMERGELLFGTVDTWVVYRLTRGAVFASNYSNASTTRVFNNLTMDWDRPFLEYLGVSPDMFPAFKYEADDYGVLDKGILGVEIPITGVGADQQSALFSQGCFTPWSVKSTNGTGSFVTFNIGEKYGGNRGLYSTVIAWKLRDQTRFMAEGFLPTAGVALEWLKDNMHMIESFQEADHIVARTPDSGGVYFSPALNGFRAPLNDATARAGFLGMSGSTTREHCVRAVMEAIGYANAHIMEDMQAHFNAPKLEVIKLSGGVAKSPLLGQMLANLTGARVEKPRSLEASAVGAAEFAGLQAGIYTLADLENLLPIETVYEPDQNREKHLEGFAKWKEAILRTTEWHI